MEKVFQELLSLVYCIESFEEHKLLNTKDVIFTLNLFVLDEKTVSHDLLFYKTYNEAFDYIQIYMIEKIDCYYDNNEMINIKRFNKYILQINQATSIVDLLYAQNSYYKYINEKIKYKFYIKMLNKADIQKVIN